MTTLSFDLYGRDHGAKRAIQEVAQATDQAHSSFRKLIGAVSGLALGGEIVRFGKESVAAFGRAQESHARLAYAFQQFPKLADTNQAALQRLDEELQRKTTFDHNALASGQAILAQFGLTGKQITQVTPLLADYAAKTGQDIPSAAQGVGKALLGNTRALKAVGIQFKATGDRGKDFATITDLLSQKVGGFAEVQGKTAAGRMQILKHSFEDLQEEAGRNLVPALTAVVGGLTSVVDWVGKNEKTIGPLILVVGTLGVGLFAASKAVNAFRVAQELMSGLASKGVAGLNALKIAFTGVELTAKGAGRAMRVAELSIPVVGVALFAVTEILSHFASKGDDATQTTNDFAQAMQTVKGNVTLATAALDENVRAVAVSGLQSKGAYEQAKLLGISYGTVTDAALGNKDAIAEVNKVTSAAAALNPQLSKSNSELSNTAIALSGTLIGQATNAKSAADAERVRRGAMQQGSVATVTLADLTGQLAGKEAALNTELQKSINKFTILKQGALDVGQADMAWQSSIDAVTQSVKTNGHSLDIHTDKGRANRTAIIGMITALNDKTTADVKNAGVVHKGETATDAYSRVVRVATNDTRNGERQIRAAAKAAGLNADQVNAMIRQYLKTPKQVATDVRTRGVRGALNDIHNVQRALGAVKSRSVDIHFSTNAYKIGQTKFAVNLTAPSSAGRMASGGTIGGWSPHSRADNIPIMATAGEEIIRASQAAKHRPLLKAINSGTEGFADGGTIGRSLMVNASRVPASAWQLPKVAGWFAGALAKEAGSVLGKGLAAGLQSLLAASAGGSRVWPTNTHRLSPSYPGHSGVDIAAGMGAPIWAAAPGSISYTGWGHGFGQAIFERIGGGLTAIYGHTSRLLTRAGARVSAGDRIGNVGATGHATGPHLHFEITGVGAPGTPGNRAYTLRWLQGVGASGVSGGASVSGGVRAMAQQLLRLHGWEAQFPALDYIVNHESGWNVHARNPGSGAYGLGQALPASKMAPFGSDYRDSANTQLRWMLSYIGSRYGDPNQAASFWRSHNWYDDGGVAVGSGMVAKATLKPERMLSPRQTQSFDNLVQILDRRNGGTGNTYVVHVSAPNYVGSTQDLERALVKTMQTGRLDKVIQRTATR